MRTATWSNSMLAYDIKNLGGRMIPSRMEMIPADEPGNKRS